MALSILRKHPFAAFLVIFALCFWILWAMLGGSNPSGPPPLDETMGGNLSKLLPEGKDAAPDIAILANNQKVKLSDFKGKVVLLDFWATWCGPCRESIPSVEKLYTKYKDRGFQVMGPALEQEKDDSKLPAAREELGMTYPIGLPETLEQAHAYGTESIPAMVLVDKKGMIRWHQNGYLPGMESVIEQHVQKLLAE